MQIQECKTAEEVRALARVTHERRQKLYAPRREPAPVLVSATQLMEPFIPPAPMLPHRPPFMAVSAELPPPLTIKTIMNLVAERYGVRAHDIVSRCRTANIVGPRQIVMYLAKRLTHHSLPEIGRRLGGRDHTTIIHGIRKIDRLRAACPEFDADLSYLAAILKPAAE